MTFKAQVDDIRHTLTHIANFDDQIAAGHVADLDTELLDAILTEAGRFAGDVIAPINFSGDQQGATLNNANVTMPPGWRSAYEQWAQGGWAALPCRTEHGGQGLPLQVGLAVQEIWNTASMAFGIGTILTQGAVEAIYEHGSEELQGRYLPAMISGKWMGTMNLTEPQAGSDLAAIRATAEPRDDGSYAIKGTKIFITYGDHDLTDNIVHLVLARLPDAPAGTRGISLFLVPKFLVNEDGTLGGPNDVACAGLEHKLGIHASATCVMAFGENGGATGWLLGEENKGLACMFTMMNNARLHVGIQGVAIAERAYQQALGYAHDRRQGRRPGGADAAPIVEHPDVRRMLMTMKGFAAAARAICYVTAHAIDQAHLAPDEADRAAGQDLADLLTPVAKAFSTDIGVEVASMGVQVHGGMGFIEETGAAQHYRDARIAPIYEGTNGIQAIDLVARKLPLKGGEVVHRFITGIREDVAAILEDGDESLGRTGYRLSQAVESLSETTDWILQRGADEPDHVLAGAATYLRMFGLVAGGVFMACGARASGQNASTANLARFYCENILPQVTGLALSVTTGADSLLDMPADQLAV